MFTRARRRLTVLYIALFSLIIGAFSVVFYVGFVIALEPNFDIGPEVTNTQAAEQAYQAAIDRVATALVVADVIVIAIVGLAAWALASWTLRPIREAHTRQRRFVSDASHEMRTPLAAIRATAEGALTRPADADALKIAMTGIVRSSERIARLTDDLLLLARTDEHAIERRAEGVDLSVLAAEALEEFGLGHPGFPAPQAALEPDVVVAADASEIRRIVQNLLDNAYRYGGEAVEVRLATRSTDREGVLEVTDGGTGIAAADLERIFEPFFRVHADAASPAGSGLGLAIARGLAERNGGRLTATSRPGSGSTFRLTLRRFR